MSGSESEWERLAFSIIDDGLEHEEKSFWSDMLALIDLKTKGDEQYRLFDMVLPGYDRDWTTELCQATQENIAVHFSHSDMMKSGHHFDERPVVSKNWIEDWKSKCIDNIDDTTKVS